MKQILDYALYREQYNGTDLRMPLNKSVFAGLFSGSGNPHCNQFDPPIQFEISVAVDSFNVDMTISHKVRVLIADIGAENNEHTKIQWFLVSTSASLRVKLLDELSYYIRKAKVRHTAEKDTGKSKKKENACILTFI